MGLCSTNDWWCFHSDFVITDIPGCNKIVDDVLIAAPDYNTLEQRVRLVLERCKKAGLAMAGKKFEIGTRILK